MSRVVGLLVALGMVVSTLAAPGGTRALPLSADHRAALLSLAEPIERCIHSWDHELDIWEGAFHGCFDWHSAVHANLALRLVGRLTGEGRYGAVADEVASAQAMLGEQEAFAAGAIAAELPYGYAWLLLLDAEADRDHIHALAMDAAAAMRAWLRDGLDDPAHVAAARYSSSTFPAYALHRWYRHFDPPRARRFAARAVPRLLAQREVACAPVTARPGFLDPCGALLLALSQMARDVAVDRQALAGMAAVVAARPVLRSSGMTTIFQAGLNFSRAWALYAAADMLDDARLVARGDRLFRAHMAQPALWRDEAGYADYSHWVAQFGVYALALRSEISLAPSPAPTPAFPAAQPIPQPAIPAPLLGPRPVGPSVWAW